MQTMIAMQAQDYAPSLLNINHFPACKITAAHCGKNIKLN
jgi:hypothetical protein